MADSDNTSIARTFYEDWNKRDFDHLADLVAGDGEILLVGSGTSFRGPDGARQFARMWADGFPDGRVTVDTAAAAGDQVTVEHTGRGTHTGTLQSAGGDIPATGKRSRSSSVTSSRSKAARSRRCTATSTRPRC
jgi:predicted ester cyclase